MILGGDSMRWNKKETMRAYEQFVLRYLEEQPYDLIVRLHIEFEPDDTKEHSWKERDAEDRKETEHYLNKWFYEHKMDIPVVVVSGAPEERAQQIMQKLEELKKAVA